MSHTSTALGAGKPEIGAAVDHVYGALDGIPLAREFAERHGITSLAVLTILNPEDARATVQKFRHAIAGRRVVEIGAGVGFLALEMAKYAKSVVAIENEPAWSWIFTKFLYREKPQNLTWVFGHSSSLPELTADIVVICSRSGLAEMVMEARKMAPEIALISCEEPFISVSWDPVFDAAAEWTKGRIAELFVEAEEAVKHPEKRAAYEAMTVGKPIDWERLAEEFATKEPK